MLGHPLEVIWVGPYWRRRGGTGGRGAGRGGGAYGEGRERSKMNKDIQG